MRRRVPVLTALFFFLACTSFAAAARAEESACPQAGSPWVRLSLEGAYLGGSVRARVLQQIKADLERKGLAVCEAAAAGDPVAELRITLARPASLTIELRDEVSHERFAREVSLTGVPTDALDLSIAATAEELLYASWAQNAVAALPAVSATPSPVPAPPPSPPSASSPATSPPPRAGAAQPTASVAAPTASESAPARSGAFATNVYLFGAGETASQGATAFGADLGFTWGGRATLGARAGFRLAPAIASPHGSIEMREGVLRLTGAVAFVRRRAAWGAEGVVHGDLLYVAFDGVAAPTAHALSGTATGVVLSAGLGGWAKVARSWSIVGEVTGGAPIHAVTASDSGDVVTGIRGLVVGFALGVAMQI